ncbi:MAG TPA: GNAT family N-acetyltransferase [Chroococcales cyanobacterium]
MANQVDDLIFVHAVTFEQLAEIRQLFLEYAESLSFKLCFQSFDAELNELPGKYAGPDGCLLLAAYRNEMAGCVGLRKLSDEICEMKRLYVRPRFHGLGIGKALIGEIVAEGRRKGYKHMRLDTVPSMATAIALYGKFGFREIEAYCDNPIEGALYLELELQPAT